MREKRVIIAATSTSAVIDENIINSIRGNPLSFLKSPLVLIVIFSIILHSLFLYYLSSIKISVQDTLVIENVPERFARLIVEKPIPKKTVEAKRNIQSTVAGEQNVTEQHEQKTQSGPITTVQRKKARQKVQANVSKVEQKVRTVGVLGMLTGVGATAKGPSVADVLGTIGDKSDKFKDLDDALSKMTGLKKASQVEILDKKLVKSKEISVSHKEEIDDLIAGVGLAESVNLTKKGNFIIQRPESIEGAASSDARRDNNAINEIVSSHKASIRMTYEKFLKRDPSLTGKITIQFTITASGSVTNIRIVENTTGSTDFEQELIRKMTFWKFDPIPEGDVTVSYPFVFSSSG
ncbi:MAG TPA: AgmX/PglI C-terminal domain-containing protein [Chitinispirillaceae bacterium]|nr:AgmX/PglI C-terminal domain-containing protein [Chitinispirillaceae bacterium]